MLWASAFRAAKRVEAEGVAAFESGGEMNVGSRKGKRSLDDSAAGAERGEEDDEGGGCFRQPAGLSAFYKRLKSEAEPGGWPPLPGAAAGSSSSRGAGGAPSEAPEKRDNLALQICRAWLKRHYLGLGQECDGLKCGRSHKAPQNIGKMYTDYSFKGLSKENRAKIITKMEREQAASGSNESADVAIKEQEVVEVEEEEKPTEMVKKDKKDKKKDKKDKTKDKKDKKDKKKDKKDKKKKDKVETP